MEKYAVIDVGTNNILLLIARKQNDEIITLKKSSRTSALGRNMRADNITGAALARAKKILREYIQYCKFFTSNIIVVGTSTARRAANIKLLQTWLKSRFNINFKIISGEEEAYLNGLANLGDFAEFSQLLLFDVGGGSTEFTYVNDGKIDKMFSLELGIRRLHNEFSNMKNRLKYTREILRKLPKTKAKLVGIGGTVTSLVAISQNMDEYDTSKIHKQILTESELQTILSKLKNSNRKTLQKIMPFEPKRAEIILTGTMIVKEIVAYFGVQEIFVSDKGLQYGILNLPRKKLEEYLGER
ncbi:MAG: exopolyphosphatase / guanosine-5-triphosphate,3-diphosphate pyrophosphatase [Candidatus Cloacimonadota bacterium]|jgi:exopolyphosphatase/guanosine-5'-triphosphate,3'-diphosphate pyrophosphatase|nr:exopolyphosphatase / guanosine-5-triphosphate,3-diphosphate pyrophosphatase [Candidatus Cloacimonadota bacterium]